jgi:DNA-binding CsgD family transcriptional regulator
MNNKSQESLADELYISINTLKYRIKKMYVKLGIGRWEQFVKLLEKYSIKL